MVPNPRATAIAAIIVLLTAASFAEAAEPYSGPVSDGANAQTTGIITPPKSSRLRFRSGGPACMCVSGMSEAEIADAAERRRPADDLPNITDQDP